MHEPAQPPTSHADTALFGSLIDTIPISVWIEDFSEVKKIRKRLLADGVTDFRAYLESSPEIVQECLQGVRILAVNDETLRLHGASSRDDLLENLEATFTEQSVVDFREELIQLFDGRACAIREAELQTLDGKRRQVEVRVSVDEKCPDWSRVFVVLVDLTQQKQIEAELRLQKSFLAETERVGQIGGWSLDAATHEIIWTDETFHIFGLSPGARLTIESVLSFYPQSARAILGRAIEACISEGKAYDLELPFRDARSQHRWMRSVGRADSVDGVVTRISGTLQDVTSRRASEKRRRKLEADVLHNDKLKSLGVLAGGIAHDFNNILAAIIGNTELAMLNCPSAAPNRKHLVEIEQAARRAAGLTGQMLAYSGRGYSVESAVDLNDFVQELLSLLQLATKGQTSLSFAPLSDLLPILIDPDQVRQVLLNMVSNAAEAVPEQTGQVDISLQLAKLTKEALADLEDCLPLGHSTPLEGGEFIALSVEDNGCGMEPETLRQMLDPFFTTKFTGRGLGMAAVAGILRSRKAAISAKTSPGMGCSLSVFFPLVYADSSGEFGAARTYTPPLASLSTGVAGRALLADDEPAVLKITRLMLERLGFAVVTAADGQEALEYAMDHVDELTLCLFDVTMPRLDGIALFERVRQFAPELPVILSSGYDPQGFAERLRGLEPSGFIQKPFSFDELKGQVGRALIGPGQLG